MSPSRRSSTSSGILGQLPVRDLMQRDVATLRADATAEEAIALFEEYHISGAPVVDGADRLVGVLSASDVTRSEHVDEGRLRTSSRSYYLQDAPEDSLDDSAFDEPSFPQDDYSPRTMEGARVRDWMSPSVVSVEPTTTLGEACRLMAQESIHRVLVVQDDKLVGILSASDVVRAVADAE